MRLGYGGGRRSIRGISPQDNPDVSENNSNEDRIATLDDILDGVMVQGKAGFRDAKKIVESSFFKEMEIIVDLDCDEYRKILDMEDDDLKSQQESFYVLINKIPRHIKLIMRSRAEFSVTMGENKSLSESDLKKGFARWIKNKVLLRFDDVLHEFIHTLDEVDAEKDLLKKEQFGIYQGIKNMITNEYITSTWLNMAKQADPADVAQDIIAFNGNLALTGALIVTLAFPMFLGISSDQYEEDWAFVVYTFAIVACGVLEAIVLLISIRNIIAVTLVDTSNMFSYIAEAQAELVWPIKFNIGGVVALIISLLCYGYSTFGVKFFLYFLCVLTIPGFLIIFGLSARGIRAIHRVQPWKKKKKDELFAANYSEISKEIVSRKSAVKSKAFAGDISPNTEFPK